MEQGRQIVLAGLTGQNLPGLSVAVGVGGELVWAEGFGWADLDNRVPVAPQMRFRIGTASVALTSAAVGLLLKRRSKTKPKASFKPIIAGKSSKTGHLLRSDPVGYLRAIMRTSRDPGPPHSPIPSNSS